MTNQQEYDDEADNQSNDQNAQESDEYSEVQNGGGNIYGHPQQMNQEEFSPPV